MNKKCLSIALVLAGTIAVVIPALADTNSPTNNPASWSNRGGIMKQGFRPAVTGTVTSVSGTTITVSAKKGLELGKEMGRGKASTTPKTTPASITYTVDASVAAVMKNNATSSISSIAVGDIVMVQGTISGTTIKATTIRDGVLAPRQMNKESDRPATSSLPFQGNGQPVIAGTISAVNGSTVTVTNRSNVTYTVNATNAQVTKGQGTTPLSNLTVGDNVIVQGVVNGTSVVASSIIDQSKPTNNVNNNEQKSQGFFGRIGSFFKSLFGF